MSESTPEGGPLSMEDALLAFLSCVGTAIPDICTYSLIHGESYVPFNPDPEDTCDAEEAACSQIWVRVTNVTPRGGVESFGGDSCGAELEIGLEVGVMRCMDIPEEGEAPTAMDSMLYSLTSLSDMNALFCAAMSCEVWGSITAGDWQPHGPLGGQYGGTWDFTVTPE